MTARLLFATRNPGKLIELRQLLADVDLEVLSLDDLDRHIPDVVEDADTLAGNATKKALEVSAAAGLPALADDSGIEIDALDGAPGVRSARFAGEPCDDRANNARVLELMRGLPEEQRSARFRAVLALADCAGALGERVLLAEGVCEGRILEEPRGTGGFGYDPLFFSPELGATFAEIGVGTKGQLSHRARAMQEMKPLLTAYFRLNAR